MKPLCFVLMPFGTKKDQSGKLIDFDAVYHSLIEPAVIAAQMEPVRADQEEVGGAIHKPMFERLLLCDFAVADVTGANPNVYYELGIRHALRPRTTVIIFADDTLLPFDIAMLRGLPYHTDSAGAPSDLDADIASLRRRITAARADTSDDSPVYQLVDDMPRIEIPADKSTLFRERADYSRDFKERLAQARSAGSHAKESVIAIANDPAVEELFDIETGIVVDVFLSLRAVEAFEEMIAFHDKMPEPLRRVRLVREQLAFALGRLKRQQEAAAVLQAVIDDHGPSSETLGLLGGVYKQQWLEARGAGETIEARGYLKRAIAKYVEGFYCDWRDPYPGISAVTLMEWLDPPDERQQELLPVVRFSIQRRAESAGEYWDHASVLELAVLARDRDDADDALAAACASVEEAWQLESTAQNIRVLRDVRQSRGEDVSWVDGLIAELESKYERTTGCHPIIGG